jgi:hypothetical protein
MGTIDQFGAPTDRLSAPPLGGGGGWAAAVRDAIKAHAADIAFLKRIGPGGDGGLTVEALDTRYPLKTTTDEQFAASTVAGTFLGTTDTSATLFMHTVPDGYTVVSAISGDHAVPLGAEVAVLAVNPRAIVLLPISNTANQNKTVRVNWVAIRTDHLKTA